jgi:diguanylate cyclase (GGDEF)-like protein
MTYGHLDLFTLTLVSAQSFLLAGLALFASHRLDRTCLGLRRSVFGCLLLAAGCGILAFSLSTPNKPRIMLVNVLFFAGAGFLLDGVRSFRSFQRPLRTYAVSSLAFALAFLWFLYIKDDANARTAVRAFSLGTIELFAAGTMAIRVARRDRLVYWSTAALFAFHAACTFARGFAALFGPPIVLFVPRPIDFLGMLALNLLGMGSALGLAMAANLRLQRQAEKLARYDLLTNLPNRRLFEERLEQAELRANTAGHGLALIYCDLDNFKDINDTVGHEGGDEALRIVAARLQSAVREDTCLARVGGDEFLVLIENPPHRESIRVLAERLKNRVEGEIEFRGKPVSLRMSYGLAVFPDDVGSPSDMIRLADAGMYMAKQNWRRSLTAA